MVNIKIDKIIRSDRKSYSIEIDRNGFTIIRVPRRASNKEINEVIEKKSKWILKKQYEVESKRKEIKRFNFKTGEIFKCLDENYELILEENPTYAFKNENNKLYLHSEFQEYAKQIIIDWYKYKAFEYIAPKTKEYADKLNLNYNQVKISNAKTRWGSCSAKKNLNFSWRLIIAPIPVVDYVIVHELAHLIEMNHSIRFWNIVRSVKPNYKIYETWLKENGHLLNI